MQMHQDTVQGFRYLLLHQELLLLSDLRLFSLQLRVPWQTHADLYSSNLGLKSACDLKKLPLNALSSGGLSLACVYIGIHSPTVVLSGQFSALTLSIYFLSSFTTISITTRPQPIPGLSQAA